MPYTANPIWPFPPNWSEGVLERLKWRTDVLSSESGYEQRVSRRLTPRRSFEASFLIPNRNRQYFDNLMTVYGASNWALPIWHQVTRLTATALTGDNIIYLDTQFREYRPGSLVLLRGRGFKDFEVHTIEQVFPTYLKLISILGKDWNQGTFVYPAQIAILDANLSPSKKTDKLFGVSASFNVAETNPFASDNSAGLPVYRGDIVLNNPPDDSEELTFEYQRLTTSLDNDIGIPVVTDTAGKGFTGMAYRWSFAGRQKNEEVRKLLYYLRGRAAPVWVPTFMDDMTLALNYASGDGYIDVVNVGFSALGVRKPGREDIRIQLKDGSAYYRRITGGSAQSDDVDRLILSSSLPRSITTEDVAQISYVMRCRLDQDEVEINHVTDTDGLTSIAVVWHGPTLYEENSVTWIDPVMPADCDCFAPGNPCVPTFILHVPLTTGPYDIESNPATWGNYSSGGGGSPNYTLNGAEFTPPPGESQHFGWFTPAGGKTQTDQYPGLDVVVSVDVTFLGNTGSAPSGDPAVFFSYSNGPQEVSFMSQKIGGVNKLLWFFYASGALSGVVGDLQGGTNNYSFVFRAGGHFIEYRVNNVVVHTLNYIWFNGTVQVLQPNVAVGINSVRFKDVLMYSTGASCLPPVPTEVFSKWAVNNHDWGSITTTGFVYDTPEDAIAAAQVSYEDVWGAPSNRGDYYLVLPPQTASPLGEPLSYYVKGTASPSSAHIFGVYRVVIS